MYSLYDTTSQYKQLAKTDKQVSIFLKFNNWAIWLAESMHAHTYGKNDYLDRFHVSYFLTMTKIIQNGEVVLQIMEIEKSNDLIGQEHAWVHLW